MVTLTCDLSTRKAEVGELLGVWGQSRLQNWYPVRTTKGKKVTLKKMCTGQNSSSLCVVTAHPLSSPPPQLFLSHRTVRMSPRGGLRGHNPLHPCFFGTDPSGHFQLHWELNLGLSHKPGVSCWAASPAGLHKTSKEGLGKGRLVHNFLMGSNQTQFN